MIPLELRVPAGLARRRRAPAADGTAKPPAPSRKEASAERRARRLALAYWIERAIDEGRLQDYAHAARVLGVSRARITQVMDMLLLPVAEQEATLVYRAAVDGACGSGDNCLPAEASA